MLGTINIEAASLELNPGLIQAASSGNGNAGSIIIKAQQINLQNAGLINTNAVSSGNAGTIHIMSDTLSLNNECLIASFAAQAGGGNIELSINNQIYLVNNSWITAEKYGIKPEDNGGNLTIDKPKFFIMI